MSAEGFDHLAHQFVECGSERTGCEDFLSFFHIFSAWDMVGVAEVIHGLSENRPKLIRIIFQQLIFQELNSVSFRFQLLWLVHLPPLTWLIHQVVSLDISS